MHYKCVLHRNVQRSPCPECGRSRKYYCYDCYALVGVTRELIPTVALPFKIDMYVTCRGVWCYFKPMCILLPYYMPYYAGICRVKHKEETSGKSTSAHAKILSPDWVTIYQYPVSPTWIHTLICTLSTLQDMPKYDKTKTVLIYPKEVHTTFFSFVFSFFSLFFSYKS